MPFAPLRPCASPGCTQLVERGRCVQHARRTQLDERRGSARERGYDHRWERARQAFLDEGDHRLCAHCKARGLVAASSLVDHIVPHRGDEVLFWLVENWQPLDTTCHQTKGLRESGLIPCPHELPAVVVAGRSVCVLCGCERVGAALGRGGSNLPDQPPGTAQGGSRVRHTLMPGPAESPKVV